MKNVGLNTIPSVRGYIGALTANLALIGVVYIFLGGFVSYMLSAIFPNYDQNWKEMDKKWQVLDIAAEIAAITIIGFWTTYIVNSWVPVFHLHSRLEYFIESYGGQVVFLYALFIFLDGLDEKLKYMFKRSG